MEFPDALAPRRRSAVTGCLAALFVVVLSGCAAFSGRTACAPGQASSAQGSATPCLYDPESRTHRECLHVTADGTCAHFGTACTTPAATQSNGAPAAKPCLYDTASAGYRECHHVTADGGCAHFGAACSPS